VCASSDWTSKEALASRGTWRQGVIRQAIDPVTGGLEVAGAQRQGLNRQAVCAGFA